MSALTVLRTDTVFAKLPIHTLTKAVPIDICIHQSQAQGVQDLHWKVSPSAAYGAPQFLAYKLDTLVVNRQLDALTRPLPSLICLGSLRQICQDLGQSREASTGNLKRAFHQNAGVYITAKLHYRDVAGKQRRLEAGFHRYGVVFTGESLPDGSTADAVYLILHESYRQVLNAAPTRPVDYDYLVDLKPLAQRFYELLSFKMYAALKYRRAQVAMLYSELCQFAPQHRHYNGNLMSKQMYRVHLPHLESGYLAAVETERILDAQGEPDWLLHYTPGPKALAEYQSFTRLPHKAMPAGQIPAGMEEPAEALVGGSQSAFVKMTQVEFQTDVCIMAQRDGERDPRVEYPPREPAAIAHNVGEFVPPPADATDGQIDPAIALVQQFYREVHGVSSQTPHTKEIEHARGLLHRHGLSFASFFLIYAQKAMREEGRTAHVFGGLMRYETSALAACQRQKAQAANAQSQRSAAHHRRQQEAYEAWLRQQLETIKAALAPEELAALKRQARQQYRTAKKLPPYLLKRQVAHDVDTQLMNRYQLPPFENWAQEGRC